MRIAAVVAGFCVLSACAREDLPRVYAAAETAPVASLDDAADDPAIWLHPDDPAKSLIIGTDKQAGLYVYDLSGAVKQFLPAGRPNNVDLRQGVALPDGWRGDLAAASDRADDTIALFAASEAGVEKIGAFPSAAPEPYGLCMGLVDGAATVFVAHKTGALIQYALAGFGGDAGAGRDGGQDADQPVGVDVARIGFASQLEGCVFDDEMQVLYVGEEAKGVWRVDFENGRPGEPALIDEVAGASGVRADVEGLALYRTGEGTGYLIASSQGNDSFAVYDRAGGNRFIGRFAVGEGEGVDGAQETDGIEATAADLGQAFPNGALVVQDGRNLPRGEAQNFKIIDWRDVEALPFMARGAQ